MNLSGSTALAVFLLLQLCHQCASLTCQRCEETKCKDPRMLHCRGGTATDACGCCTVCAKLEGEICGGPWNIRGKCDKGLVCKQKDNLRGGICYNRTKTLPKCISSKHYHNGHRHGFWFRRHRRCSNTDTIFCLRSCKKCCTHANSCNPDRYKYISKSRCQRQMRQYAPKNLFFADETDENEVELDSMDKDIKG